MKFEKTFQDAQCAEYDIIVNGNKVAYYVEYVKNPQTDETLENPVFEIYFDYDDEAEEFTASYVCDSLDEALEAAELI